MDLNEAIRKRYSCRSYENRPVEDDKLRAVLEAGRLAPSGRNLQGWKFVVIRDAATRARLVEACEQEWMASAPVIIAVVSTDPERTMFCEIPAAPVDCAIPIDHMTLTATAEGLATCWIGHFKQDACKRIIQAPAETKIIELLTLGYPADLPGEKKRKPLDDILCWDRYE
jgi:nitroreductase